MNITQLTEGLKQAFFKEDHRLVFWFDPSKILKPKLPIWACQMSLY